MHIDWFPDNSPQAVRLITSHTLDVMRQMDNATKPVEVKRLFDEWMRFARGNRVCRQICEHMVDKRKHLLQALDDDRPPHRDWQREAAADR